MWLLASTLHSAPSESVVWGGDTHLKGSRGGGSALILVVDRDPHTRDLERFFLEEAGFTVVFAADGDEALAVARAQRPDLVITEILVPGMDGLAICRELRAGPDLKGTRVRLKTAPADRLTAACRALSHAQPLEEVLRITIDSAVDLVGAQRAVMLLEGTDGELGRSTSSSRQQSRPS